MKARWIASARQDRVVIAAGNPSAALVLDQFFSDVVTKLGDFYLLGREGAVPGTRELTPHESYRLVYEVDEEDATVWMLALVHTARQWPPTRYDNA